MSILLSSYGAVDEGMRVLSNEEKIILLCSRVHLSDKDTGELEEFIGRTGKQVDYRRLVSLAGQNGVAPLVYRNLKALQSVPADIIAVLQRSYFAAIAENTKKIQEIMRIHHLLTRENIDLIFLKGALAAEMIFDDPGLYCGSDIDILVRSADLDKMKKVLIRAGYHYDASMEKAMLLSHYHLALSTERHSVEAHWNLVKRYFTVSPDFWWEDTASVEYEGKCFLRLSPEKYLLYLIFRLFAHAFSPLKFFVLASELIRKYHQDMDWDKLMHLSRLLRMERLVVFTLVLMNELLDTEIPANLKGKKPIMYSACKDAVLNGLFSEGLRPQSRKILYLMLLSTPHEILYALFRRFFPGEGELRLRYRIPEKSKKLYLYYLLNPVLLFLLMFRKKQI